MTKSRDIRKAVEDELLFDSRLDSSRIRVQNMGGEVALNGSVSSYPQYLEAVAAARRLTGVTGVHNHLEVVLPPGSYRDDPTLTTAANNALGANLTVPDTVEAEARDGNVALTGTVLYGYQRAAAEAAVTTLPGVRNIRDYIEISSDADPWNVTVAVQDAVDRNALVPDDSDVVVDTHGNTVTLTGHVRTWAEHDAVLDAAWMSPAVYDVHDKLVVTA